MGNSNGNALATGRVTNAVYFGTDTHYHLELHGFAESADFIVRVQNTSQGFDEYRKGDAVGISFGSADVQILKD